MTGNFEALLELAKQGDDLAQYKIGKVYLAGDGVPRDAQKAQAWFLKSGYYCAYYSLGVMYEHGDGVPQSDADAVKWYLKAGGYARALFNLALMYEQGRGVEQSYERAFDLYRQVAECGNMKARFKVGYAYLTGNGVHKDALKASTIQRVPIFIGRPFVGGNMMIFK